MTCTTNSSADEDKAKSMLNLVSFQPFADTADAVTAATSCIEGKVNKSLKSFLKKQFKKKDGGESLAVADKTLAASIKDKLSCSVVNDSKTAELFRGIRCYMDELMEAGDDEAGGVSFGCRPPCHAAWVVAFSFEVQAQVFGR